MKNEFNRRDFVKTAALGGIGLGLAGNINALYAKSSQGTRSVGIIGELS